MKSEQVAGFVSESMAGFIGIRIENAHRYLKAVVGDRLNEEKVDAFLSLGPRAIRELVDKTDVQFRPRPHHPDYHSLLPGATSCGRALEPMPFDAKLLGEDMRLVRRPLDTLTVWGMMADANDIRNLLSAFRSPRAFAASMRLFSAYGRDLLLYRRTTRLLMGNALVARLLLTARKLGVQLRTETTIREIIQTNGAVSGVVAKAGNDIVRFDARLGVVLATGGFTHSKGLRERVLPQPVSAISATPDSVTGDGINAGLTAGGTLKEDYPDGAFWAPVSLRPLPDGRRQIYPHFFLDRGKPGFIAVDRSGQRFVNEATSYDAFVTAMYARQPTVEAVPSYLIADSRAVKNYGIGLVRPGGMGLRRLLAENYLQSASDLRTLAGRIGVDPDGLERTVTRFNAFAKAGCDEDFHRGETTANKVLGDPAHLPNTCLGPLETPPYYALRIQPGLNGTSSGLNTDNAGRVLDSAGTPINGLYACGNDMASLMEGEYPGPGTTLGPAITFAYAAVQAMTA